MVKCLFSSSNGDIILLGALLFWSSVKQKLYTPFHPAFDVKEKQVVAHFHENELPPFYWQLSIVLSVCLIDLLNILLRCMVYHCEELNEECFFI